MKEILKTVGSTSFTLISICLIFIGCFAFVKYNILVLEFISRVMRKAGLWLDRHGGRKTKNIEKKFRRTAFLQTDSMVYDIYLYFDRIIDNLNLQKEGVTVTGLLAFIATVSAIASLLFGIVFSLGLLIVVFFILFCLFLIIFFKLSGLTRMEAKENWIMDAIDLIVSDIQDGVFNAIVKYERAGAFDKNISGYFQSFINNIQLEGHSFEQAMIMLNDDLGYTFSDFAHKAIYYERSLSKETLEVFADLIEFNRFKRTIREINNLKFADCTRQVIISVGMILVFVIFSLSTEPFIYEIMTQTLVGKILFIVDLLLVVIMLSRITTLKAESLK